MDLKQYYKNYLIKQIEEEVVTRQEAQNNERRRQDRLTDAQNALIKAPIGSKEFEKKLTIAFNNLPKIKESPKKKSR
jgi:hypothetical protein